MAMDQQQPPSIRDSFPPQQGVTFPVVLQMTQKVLLIIIEDVTMWAAAQVVAQYVEN